MNLLAHLHLAHPDELFPFVPPDGQGFLRHFIDRDYISAYGTVDGLTQTFARVSRRIAERIPRRAIWLPDAMPDLLAADSDLRADFLAFYPDLVAYAQEQRAGLADPPRGFRSGIVNGGR